MSLLVVTRGLPASGKTTIAKKWVAEDVEKRVRVNRDSLRAMLYDNTHIPGVTEFQVINARDFIILGFLRGGKDVICDDTNLSPRDVRNMRKLASKTGSKFQLIDLTTTPLEECLARNAARTDKPPVPEEWIREQHATYIAIGFRAASEAEIKEILGIDTLPQT
jgi:predicted kinase